MDKERLKAWRKSHNLTQRQMAEKLGCTERYYHGLETGEYKPSSIMERLIKVVLNFE